MKTASHRLGQGCKMKLFQWLDRQQVTRQKKICTKISSFLLHSNNLNTLKLSRLTKIWRLWRPLFKNIETKGIQKNPSIETKIKILYSSCSRRHSFCSAFRKILWHNRFLTCSIPKILFFIRSKMNDFTMSMTYLSKYGDRIGRKWVIKMTVASNSKHSTRWEK